MNFLESFKDILLEKEGTDKQKENKKKYVKGLKIFYVVDINIKDPEEDQEKAAEMPTQPPPAEVPAPAPVATPQVTPQESFREKVNSLLEEEGVVSKKEGIIQVPEADVENIQTLEDLLDYISDKGGEDETKIIDDFAIEVIYSSTGINSTALSEILKRDDKILVDLDYGTNKKDSIGIKVLKRSGVNNISVMMKKNGNIIPAKFNLQDFNNQIITYRNSVVGDVND
jgi:hypothetical protein